MGGKRRKKVPSSSSRPSPMENLPPPIVIDILSRLADASDLARCRLTCKTLKSLSYDVPSFSFSCSRARYDNSRANPSSTPFKSVATRFITQLSRLESVSLGVDDSLTGLPFDDVEDEANDLHLTDVGFVSDWLMSVKDRLKTLTFCDFWVQASWRRSCLLSLISKHCPILSVLKVKNAWLSVEGVNLMPSLTNLTLEYVLLDDENLSKLNECFPCLQTLTLVGNGGLTRPKISLQHLKIFRWTVSDAPSSLTIDAPNLVELKLNCLTPKSLLLRTPLLSDFHLTIEKTCSFDIGELPHLHKLQLESRYLKDLIHSFPYSEVVEELSLDSLNRAKLVKAEESNLGSLCKVFPNIRSLSLGPDTYSVMEAAFNSGNSFDWTGLECLKHLTAQLVITDVNLTLTFIFYILENCHNLSSVSLLMHRKDYCAEVINFIPRCEALHPQVRWKWGFWRQRNLSIRSYMTYPIVDDS